MARLAHSIRPENVPPAVRIKVIEETRADPGKDFFEPPGLTEQHADTPAAVARVWRGHASRRRLVVSAEDSFDLNKRPLTYHWVLLRGDPARVRIRPRNKARSVAEVVVDYHPRRPVAPRSPLESNRVDVGVFADNRWFYSAPAFLTFFSLDSEARTYDAEGRTLEVGYGIGEVLFSAPDPAALFKAAAGRLPSRLLRLSAVQRLALLKAREQCLPLSATLASLAERRAALAKSGDPADRERLQKVEAQLRDAAKRLNDFLDRKRPDLKDSPWAFLDRALRSAAADAALSHDHADDLAALLAKAPPARKAPVEAARRRLVRMGLAKDGGGELVLTPIRAASAPLAERLTPYEQVLLARFHAAVLTELVFPGVLSHTFQVNYVDHRLSAPKEWRDVYRHDPSGRLLGWTRYGGDRAVDFTAGGLAVRARDDRGRPTRARTVLYRQDPPASPLTPNTNPLRQVYGDEVVRFDYDGDKVRVRRHKIEER
jgi:hypothetical protein